jgi:hypothetical protein
MRLHVWCSEFYKLKSHSSSHGGNLNEVGSSGKRSFRMERNLLRQRVGKNKFIGNLDSF